MNQFNTAPLFPETFLFPDIDADTLAREDTGARGARIVRGDQSAWHAYLRKFLPAGSPQHDVRAM